MGWQCKPQGRGREHFQWGRLLHWNVIVSLTGHYKRFYRIPLSSIFLLFYLFCIYWNLQGHKCKLKCPEVCTLALNYIVTIISYGTHPCHTNIFTHNLIRTHLLQLNIHNIWMKFYWNQKILHFDKKEISTLKSNIIFNKAVCWYVIVPFF